MIIYKLVHGNENVVIRANDWNGDDESVSRIFVESRLSGVT
jgi:hypothetical protein